MRRVLIGCGISTVVILIILFSYGWVANAQGGGIIRGKVTGDGNVALANVTVRAYYKEDFTGIIVWTYAGQVTTDGTGNYTIPNLNAGVYHISFNEVFPLPGYFAEFYNNASEQFSATDIPLAAGATVSNINARLSSGAHVKGKVTDQQGKPLSGIRVVALDANNSSNTFFDTGADGLYDIGSLQPGNYRIAFDDTRLPLIYRRQYYNNAKEIEAATAVTLAQDQILNNINAKLDRLGFITGKITNVQNMTLPAIQLTAQRRDASAWGERWLDTQFADTDANGNYVLGGLYEGVYRVRFRDTTNLTYSAEYYNNVTNPAAATLLTITLNTTTTNINAQLALRGAITGKITNNQGTPLENVEVTAEYQVVNPPENFWQTARVGRSNANGDYTLCCLDEGAYRLRFNDLQNRYMVEYYNNVYDDYHSPLDNVTMVQVTATMTTTGVNVELKEPSKLISNVTDKNNQPVADVKVTLYRFAPTGAEQWYNIYVQAERINNTYVTTLIPGRYRVQFEDFQWPPRYASEFYNNATDISTATDITVTEESTVTLQVTLADKARITGRVVNVHGDPLANITVSIYQPSTFPGIPWSPRSTNGTDRNGFYSFNNLDPGIYRVGFVDQSGLFIQEYYNNRSSLETATDVVVITDTVTANINAELSSPFGRIQGQVTNEIGGILPGIYVTAYRYNNLGNNQFSWQPYRSVQTDFYGEYQILDLEPGAFRIGFQDYGNTLHSEYYSNVGYLDNATTLTLTANLVISDVDAQLALNPFTWPPLAQDDQVIVTEGGTVNTLVADIASVLVNDRTDAGTPLQATVIATPTHGTLTFNIDGTLSYTHNGDEATTDFFTYSVNDGAQQSNVARVAITIQPVNDPPIAGNDSATVSRGQSVTGLDSGAKSLLTNDHDPDSNVLTATLKTGPAHGTVIINAHGAFTYTHDGSAGTSDSFTYQATDNLGASAVATVTVAINPFTFSKTVGIAGIKPLCTPVDEIHAPVGTTIVYCYTLRNIGNAPLTTHTLIDSHLGSLLTNHVHEVAPGAAFSVTFTQTLTVSTTNIATWTVTSAAEQGVAVPTTNIARNAATVTIAGPIDDSDGDTIPDNQEQAGDSDGDNIPNFLDTDADGDGKLDKEEVGSNPAQPVDSDQDGIPDYLDSQSGVLQRQLFLPMIKR